MTKIYMKVSSDTYQLPLAIAESLSELAQICHVTKGTISTAIAKGGNYKRVLIEDEDDEEDFKLTNQIK